MGCFVTNRLVGIIGINYVVLERGLMRQFKTYLLSFIGCFHYRQHSMTLIFHLICLMGMTLKVFAGEIERKKEYLAPKLQRYACHSPDVDGDSSSQKVLRLAGKLSNEQLASLKRPYKIIHLDRIYGDNREVFDQRGCFMVTAETLNPSVLDSLSLHLCALTSINIAGISSFPCLRNLYLTANALRDEAAQVISQLALEKLYLAVNDIGNKGVQALATITTLVEFDISLNKEVTNEGIKYFISHPMIQKLIIQCNQISPDMAEELRRHVTTVLYSPSTFEG